MARLPTLGGDDGTWGAILNDYLSVEHNSDGTLKKAADIAAKYTKPSGGIPTADIADGAVTAVKVAADVATQVELDAASQTVQVNTQTVSYILVLGDAGKTIEMNSGSATTVTVPPASSVNFADGTVIEIFRYGTGAVAVQAGSGVTIRSSGGLLGIATQYESVVLRKRSGDEWVLVGSLS